MVVLDPLGLELLADMTELLEVGRLAVEDALVEFRDSRISELNRRNGLVIAERNGNPSPVIRFGMETALRIAFKAIAGHMQHVVRAGA